MSDAKPSASGFDPSREAQSMLDMISERGLSVCPQCNGGWVIEADDGGGEQEWEVVRTRRPLRAALREVATTLGWRLPSAEAGNCEAPAFAAANPSGGWQNIRSAPKNQRVLIYRVHPDGGCDETAMAYLSGVNGLWFTMPDQRPVDFVPTHWQPLPSPPGALAGEARRAETEGLGSRASDGEAGTPEATPSISPSPRKGQEENPCPMTVEEAVLVKAPAAFSGDYLRRELELESAQSLIDSLNDGLPDDAYITPEQWALAYRWTSDGWQGSVRKTFLARADAIELALSTIRASEEDR